MGEKGTKTRVKEWVKDNAGRRGDARVLWGRWKNAAREGEEEENEGREKEDRSPKSKNPPTSRKQMRRLGEPQRKIPKLEQQPSDEHQPTKADRTGRDPQTSEGEKKGLTDGPRRSMVPKKD